MLWAGGAQDNTVRIWNLNTTVCQGLLNGAGAPGAPRFALGSTPCVTIDCQARPRPPRTGRGPSASVVQAWLSGCVHQRFRWSL